MPGELFATIVLAASSVLFGLLLPLGAALAIVGIVRGFVELRWRTFLAGLLFVLGVVAAGVFLRALGGTLAVAEELGRANATAGVVFSAVTPVGVILGVVFVVVALVRLVVDRRSPRSGE